VVACRLVCTCSYSFSVFCSTDASLSVVGVRGSRQAEATLSGMALIIMHATSLLRVRGGTSNEPGGVVPQCTTVDQCHSSQRIF